MRNRIILFIVLLSAFCSAQELQYDTIPKYSYATVNDLWQQMEDIFNDPNFSNANWGVVIQSLVTGEYFYKRNENKLFMPASNTKLFTTAAGLLQLGSNYRFKTEIFMKGNIDGSILKGDLIVKGYGDPTISGRFYNENITQVFELWADSLLERGIDEITGNIIGDDNVFDDKGLGTGWSWDYESDWYAAPSGALSLNDNCVDIIITPTKVGSKAEITTAPNSKYIILNSNVITVHKDSSDGIYFHRERGTNIVTVYGKINENSETIKRFSTINNPTQYFIVVFTDVLNKKGIRVKGFPLDVDDLTEPLSYENIKLLFTHHSPLLKDLIKVINKSSQNFFSEQLIKTIGYEKEGIGTAANGISSAKKKFSDMGINPEGLQIVDGSGLSRLNLVSPNQIVSLLNFMYKDEQFLHFYNSLPIAGVDGSLAKRMRKARTQNNVRAKTGFIGSARALSGYVFTGDKEPVAFSIIVNNFTVPVVLADIIQDLVCLRLANFKRK